MNKDLYISIEDSQSAIVTDKNEQKVFFHKMQLASSEINEETPSKSMRVFVRDAADAEIASSVISGLSWPVVITSIGYLLKHLSPIIVEFMKTRAQKEITVEANGCKITVRGGGDFEKNLSKLMSEIEALNENNSH